MLKLKLMLATVLSTTAMAVLLGSMSANAANKSIINKTNSPQDSTLVSSLRDPKVFSGVAGGVIIGSVLTSFIFKKRHLLNSPSPKIDRFKEEFLVGPLKDVYSSSCEQISAPPALPAIEESKDVTPVDEIEEQKDVIPVDEIEENNHITLPEAPQDIKPESISLGDFSLCSG